MKRPLLLAFALVSERDSTARAFQPAIPSSFHHHGIGGRIEHPLFLQTNGDANENSAAIALNELHTLLKDAVAQQDFVAAGRISAWMAECVYSDYNDLTPEEQKNRRRRMSWKGLGAAPWLADRLDMLSYTFPTTIQVSSLEAVNSILGDSSTIQVNGNAPSTTANGSNNDPSATSSTLEERIQTSQKNDVGVVVSGATGAGKTLSYAVPLLSTLSDSLFLRQRLRIADEEAVGDTAGDLADRIHVVTAPAISSAAKKNKIIATGASIATLGRSGTDVKNPLALIVVPTRELGVQTARVLYRLVGGSFRDEVVAAPARSSKDDAIDDDLLEEEQPPAPKYKGPKGVRIGCVLDEEEAAFGLKLQTDVAITTPKYLRKLLNDGDIDPSMLRVVVYDEADLALEQTTSTDLSKLFDTEHEATRLTLLVGASVTKALGNLAVSSRILPEGQSYIATATTFAPLTRSGETPDDTSVGARERVASLTELNVCLYPGLKHERVVVDPSESKLLVLTKLLRKELDAYRENRENKASPRVVIFFPDEVEAKAAIEPLRDALWGDHLLCVLLPTTGVRPLTIMEEFRKSKTSVMLATANSVRGLDFPALTHVYTLYLPIDDPREYLHLAGRVGRVGHRTEGRVVSVLNKEEASELEKLATTLDFSFKDVPVPEDRLSASELEGDAGDFDIEKFRRKFEDTYTFIKTDDDDNTVFDVSSVEDENNDDDGDVFG